MNESPDARPDGEPPPFLQLILMLSATAMQHLGKLENPVTEKKEVNLEGAQFLIDMLGAIEEKTRGNLTAEETKTLNDALFGLRLNYVETAPAAVHPASAPGGTGAGETAAKEEAKEGGGAGSEPRYRKTYD